MKHKKRIAIIMIGMVVVAVIIGVLMYNSSSGVKVRKQLELGQRYLEEMNYEQAAIAFEIVIEIDPMSVEAYLGLVEVYVRTGEFDVALDYAKKGYELTRDERLKKKIEMIESGNIFAENGWIMKESYYEGDGSLNGYMDYTYGLNGKVKTITAYNGNGSLSGKIDCQYNDKEQCIVGLYEWDYGDGELNIHKGEYEYNKEGKQIRVNIYNTDNVMSSYVEFEYNEEGKEIRAKRYYDGMLSEYEEIKYGTDGKLVRRDFYYVNGNSVGEGETHYYQETEYNVEGQRIRVKQFDDNDKLESYWEYEYNTEGKEVGCKSYDANGKLEDYYNAE